MNLNYIAILLQNQPREIYSTKNWNFEKDRDTPLARLIERLITFQFQAQSK